MRTDEPPQLPDKYKLRVFMTSTTGFGVTDYQIKSFYTVERVQYLEATGKCTVFMHNPIGHRVVIEFDLSRSNEETAKDWHQAFATFIGRFGMTELHDTDELLGKRCTLADVDQGTAVALIATLADVVSAVSPRLKASA